MHETSENRNFMASILYSLLLSFILTVLSSTSLFGSDLSREDKLRQAAEQTQQIIELAGRITQTQDVELAQKALGFAESVLTTLSEIMEKNRDQKDQEMLQPVLQTANYLKNAIGLVLDYLNRLVQITMESEGVAVANQAISEAQGILSGIDNIIDTSIQLGAIPGPAEAFDDTAPSAAAVPTFDIPLAEEHSIQDGEPASPI